MDLLDLHVVIPAGGSGTRLWPLSRRDRPKFLLDLTGSGRTMIQQTWDRVTTLVPPERVHVVTGETHAAAVTEQLPDLRHLVVEPSPRDSMPAIGLATVLIAHEHPDAVVASFPADHVVADLLAFVDAVTQAVAVARTDRVVTIGIAPRSPSTAFGYVQAAEVLDVPEAPDARAVQRFVEKPDEPTATTYLATGGYSWNAGMFIMRAQVLLDQLAHRQPTMHDGLQRIAVADDQPAELARTWTSLTRIAIDHAIAEPLSVEGGMAVVPGRFGWDDIGDFASLRRHLPTSSPSVQSHSVQSDSPQPHPTSASPLWVDPQVSGGGGQPSADGLALSTEDVTIAVVGVPDAVVVHTDDAILVTTLDQAQHVQQVPELLAAEDRNDLT